MFELELYDRIGNKLQIGDIVKISNGKEISFFSEIKYLKEESVITPFHTFSFHSFEKVDKLPNGVIKSTEERYNMWYLSDNEKDEEKTIKLAEKYLADWRACEHLLEARCFRIKLSEKQQKLF